MRTQLVAPVEVRDTMVMVLSRRTLNVRKLALSFTFFGLTLLAAPHTTHAECMEWPSGEPHHAGAVFIAKVLDASGDVDPGMPDYFNWHVELGVSKTFRGEVPTGFVMNGFTADCGYFSGSGVRKGDLVLIAAEEFGYLHAGWSPFRDNLAVWRWVGEH